MTAARHARRRPAKEKGKGTAAGVTPSSEPDKKRKPGTFLPGNCANPGGRPKAEREVRELARGYTKQAVERLAYLMDNAKQERVQAIAAEALLDRGWGRPSQSLSVEVVDPAALDRATPEQLRRIAAGEDPVAVLGSGTVH